MEGVVQLVFLMCLGLGLTEAGNCPGCVPLDTLSFDKVISAFPVSVIKIDVAYPYGDKHDEYAKVVKDAAELPNIFMGEVGVKDYGDMENQDIAKRFGAEKDDFPVLVLVKKDEAERKLGEHARFKGKFSSENIKNWIRQQTGIYLPLPGCLEEFDHIADEFMKEEKADAKKKILRKAEDAWDKVQGSKTQKRAESYVKIMRKIVSDGQEFVAKEKARLKKIKEGKIADAKKEEITERINVLRSFTPEGEIEPEEEKKPEEDENDDEENKEEEKKEEL